MKSNMSKKFLKFSVIATLAVSSTTFSSCTDTLIVSNDSNFSSDKSFIDVGHGKKGATLSFKVEPKSFSIKASGNPAKKITDILKYQVYLIKHSSSSGYPSTGDPLSSPFAGPFDITRVGSSQTITFINVIPSGTDTYYVALRAKDSSGNDLIKKNTDWGSTTQSTADGRLVVSSTGINVDVDYKVSDYTNLSLTPNLEDGFGAVIDANINNKTGALVGNLSTSENLYDYSISLVSGTGTPAQPNLGNNPAISSPLESPRGIVIDKSSNIYFGEKYRILKINSSSGIISSLAGGTTLCANATDPCGDGDSALVSKFINISDIELDSDLNIYIADAGMNKIRKIDALSGDISTIAGTGESAYLGNGSIATDAKLKNPEGVAISDTGIVYIADTGNHCIRKIESNNISLVAGIPETSGFSGDGALATSANLNAPTDISLDKEGNIYFSDTGNHCIRKINVSDGKISTVAGTPQNSGSDGDGSLATSAKLNTPKGIYVDGASNIYVADTLNNKLRRISSISNNISTIAGNGTSCGTPTGDCGDGSSATTANISSPYDLYIDPGSGKVYFSDTDNHKVRSLY
jgi:sugar lactone lactonase YvrE